MLTEKAEPQVDKNELLANLAIVIAGLIGILAAYFKKGNDSRPAARSEAVVSSVGVELGNRYQTDELIKALNRIGDILENKRQAGIEETLKRLVDEIDELRDAKRRD
jgi:hypothetical protein